jgi:hypothetical protein
MKTGIMKDKQLMDRIVLDPKVMVGKPIIKSTDFMPLMKNAIESVSYDQEDRN